MSEMPPLPTVTSEHLLAPVRRWLGDDGAEPGTWTIEQVTGGRGLVGGVYRVAGNASAGDEDVPWSLILKIVADPGGEDDQGGVNYWKREFLAYQSHLLADLPDGVAAPRCFGAVEHPGLAIWLWLEDIQASDTSWRVDDYRRIARDLGRFNGAYLVGRPLPADPWLNHQLVRKWLGSFGGLMANFPESLEHPLVRQFCPPPVAERLLHLWADRTLLLDALERLPQTLCHHDAIRSNLITSANGSTVAIDWEFVGIGAVGEELSPLIGGSLAMMAVAAEDIGDLDDAAFGGYMEGLRDMGWPGSPDLVRFACTTSAALRFGLVWALYLAVEMGSRENGQGAVERFFDQPAEAIVTHFAAALPWFLDRGDEARRLLPRVLEGV